MKPIFLLFGLTTLGGLATAGTFCSPSAAQWCEGQGGAGDSGKLPATAQYTIGTGGPGPGGTLNAIIGILGDGTTGSDMYEIYISNPNAFAADWIGTAGGDNHMLLSQGALYLYNANGTGVEAVNGPGNFLAGFNGKAGFYYIAVTAAGNNPQNNSNPLFTAFNGANISLPVDASKAIKGYSGGGCGTNCTGGYDIAFTGGGVQYSNTPEPASGLLIGSALAGLALYSGKRCKD